MLNLIIRTALNNRLAVLAVATALMIYGAMQTRELPIDVLPDLTRPRVTLITECPGLAPEEVETLVTFPIEAAVNGATGVTAVRSASDIGLSVIYVDFDWVRMSTSRGRFVTERIAAVMGSLPEGVRPRMGPISSLLGQIMLVGLWERNGRNRSAGTANSGRLGRPHASAENPGNLRSHHDGRRPNAVSGARRIHTPCTNTTSRCTKSKPLCRMET